MESANKALIKLALDMGDQDKRVPISFNAYLESVAQKPNLAFRSIFQLVRGMIDDYVSEGENEYPNDPESINFVKYDCSKLLVEGADRPFFADRLFSNRLMNNFASLGSGDQQNKIYIYKGPHGCGKSTFLDNFLMKFEEYTDTADGTVHEAVWKLNKNGLGKYPEHDKCGMVSSERAELLVPCPSHDNPLLLIPKPRRKEFFGNLIKDEDFKEKLFSAKEYQWVFRDEPCTICMSIYQALLDRLGSLEEVFSMLYARRYKFNRRLGEGISVFNPGDVDPKSNIMTNKVLQEQIDELFGDSNLIKYVYSLHAKTNNGIYALMDVKDCNVDRLQKLHGIISEGLHKVADVEECINSFFIAVSNPEDFGGNTDKKMDILDDKSFIDRLEEIKLPYVLEYATEVMVYKKTFGSMVAEKFLPRVLDNFGKVIISTRLDDASKGIKEWIKDPGKYESCCDANMHLLKMDIYSGLIPKWLSEEDRKKFTAKIRRRIIYEEAGEEGNKGFSGRESLRIFNNFMMVYGKQDRLINMKMVCDFFKKNKDLREKIPDKFLDSLVDLYDYSVLDEVKESLYYYNEDQITEDVIHYMYATNLDVGQTEKCSFTGKKVEASEEFLSRIELCVFGGESSKGSREDFRAEVQKEYSTKTLPHDIMVEGMDVIETEQFKFLFELYVDNIKEQVLEPFLDNQNFRSAIQDYDLEQFKTYDERIRNDVVHLINNLIDKFEYTEKGAQEICIYMIDNDLAKKFEKK